MTDDIRQKFRSAAHIYSDRLKAEREAAENPRTTTAKNADAFAEHLGAILAQRSNNSII